MKPGNEFINRNIPGVKRKLLISELHPAFSYLNSWNSCYTINHLTEQIFGINQKRFRKIIQKNLTRECKGEVLLNEELWLFFKALGTFIPNQDKKYQFLRDINLSDFNPGLAPALFFLLQKEEYPSISMKNKKKILNLFFKNNDYSETLNQSIPLIIQALGRQIYKIDSFLYLKNLDKLSRDNSELKLRLALDKNQNISFPSQTKFFQLNHQEIKNYVIKVPKFNHELIHMGTDLHLCVGNGFYAEKIMNNQSNIIFLEKDKYPVIVLEIKQTEGSIQILQGRKLFNQEVESDLLTELEEKLSLLF